MSATARGGSHEDTKQQTDKRLELIRRSTLAGFADTSVFERLPGDATLFLLPDDDEGFVERELRIGVQAAQRGENVFFRHVRMAELPQ